jgi:hypothetical protein
MLLDLRGRRHALHPVPTECETLTVLNHLLRVQRHRRAHIIGSLQFDTTRCEIGRLRHRRHLTPLGTADRT